MCMAQRGTQSTCMVYAATVCTQCGVYLREHSPAVLPQSSEPLP